LEFSKVEDIKETRTIFDARKLRDITKEVRIGHRILIRIAKDKTGAQQWDECSVVYNHEEGKIDHEEELLYLGRRLRLVRASGDKAETFWIASDPSKKLKGRKNFKKYLANNPEVAAALEEQILDGSED
jgi:hypothetical protein